MTVQRTELRITLKCWNYVGNITYTKTCTFIECVRDTLRSRLNQLNLRISWRPCLRSFCIYNSCDKCYWFIAKYTKLVRVGHYRGKNMNFLFLIMRASHVIFRMRSELYSATTRHKITSIPSEHLGQINLAWDENTGNTAFSSKNQDKIVACEKLTEKLINWFIEVEWVRGGSGRVKVEP
jgi:hypothetical protein